MPVASRCGLTSGISPALLINCPTGCRNFVVQVLSMLGLRSWLRPQALSAHVAYPEVRPNRREKCSVVKEPEMNQETRNGSAAVCRCSVAFAVSVQFARPTYPRFPPGASARPKSLPVQKAVRRAQVTPLPRAQFFRDRCPRSLFDAPACCVSGQGSRPRIFCPPSPPMAGRAAWAMRRYWWSSRPSVPTVESSRPG
jgi:hypothetical protein